MEKYREQVELWEAIVKLVRAVNRDFDKGLQKIGISFMEFKVLDIIKKEGSLPMVKVVSEMLITKPGLTSVVDKLERKGLVKRERSLQDRRIIMLRLTEEGEITWRTSVEIYKTMVSEILQKISPKEMNTLLEIIRRLSS
ncbi:MarR family transcriptional regulator [Sulfolobales archaeon HS-7]|nr:MarR family transcriptional regulator [Sulfolobales archaeon HS-7]